MKYLEKLKAKIAQYKKSVAVGSAVSLGAVSNVALAQSSIDVSEAVSGFADVGTAVAAVGAAMIAAIVAGIAFRWVVAYLAK